MNQLRLIFGDVEETILPPSEGFRLTAIFQVKRML